MSISNFSTSKQFVKPPQRGIFPLDHEAECKERMEQYLECLKGSKDVHHKCRELSKSYLQCRMDNQLMSKENLDDVSENLYLCMYSGVWEWVFVLSKDDVWNFLAYENSIMSSLFLNSWDSQRKRKWKELWKTIEPKRRPALWLANTFHRGPIGGGKHGQSEQTNPGAATATVLLRPQPKNRTTTHKIKFVQ